ncbi:MAG: alpha-mannosidase, partial [Firmicutes bacterium]|nr:alpha-mannosidase [Bacillota bacterium]
MSLSLEWRDRIDRWRAELKRHFYVELGEISFSGFTTKEWLTPAEALRGDLRAMPPGTPWGGKWEYGWFRGAIELPPAAAGQRIVIRADVGAEGLIFVNGLIAGAVDREHSEITLARHGVPGTRYEILVEAYAGHGPTPCAAGRGPGRPAPMA